MIALQMIPLKIINNFKIKNNLDFKLICHKFNKGPAGTRNSIIKNSKASTLYFLMTMILVTQIELVSNIKYYHKQ